MSDKWDERGSRDSSSASDKWGERGSRDSYSASDKWGERGSRDSHSASDKWDERGSRGSSSLSPSVIQELSNLKETARSHENALYDLQKRVADLIEKMATPAPAPAPDSDNVLQSLTLADFVELENGLERLAEEVSRSLEENQQKLDEFYQLVPLLIRYSWERWLLATMLALSLLTNVVNTIYLWSSGGRAPAPTPPQVKKGFVFSSPHPLALHLPPGSPCPFASAHQLSPHSPR